MTDKVTPVSLATDPLEIDDKPQTLCNQSDFAVPMCDIAERVYKLFNFIGEAESELNIVFMNDDDIQQLNKEWRDVDAPTDVLSFPMREGEDPKIAKQLPLGDIAISIPTAMRYVENCHHKDRINENEMAPLTETWSLMDELTFLIIHGTLHCLGYDHAEPEEEKVMRAKEKEWMMKVLES
ncbi:MAG: rRNA maturation RNase YbeY [Proteobacteria bacterium]|jgi:probable rRNA maturation factor|nr:rRNA maturation RNase YbeY [Pseudomonadota bacterium]